MHHTAVALARAVAPAPAPDAHLLRAFAASRDEEAFSELVRRHGPMVLAACRRVLSDRHDAEDAFQATFLVLARKPGTLRGSNLAGWLYAVAVRTARAVRLTRDRRARREQANAGRPPAEHTPTSDHDTAAVIDEELAKLSGALRDALVLCELRGLSRKQAAAALGVPEGTLSSRLASAKRKLAARLAARGLAPAVALGTLLAPAALSAGLLRSTSVAARGAAGGVAQAAASTVVKAMLFDRLRAAALGAAVCAACACGGFALTGGHGRADAPAASRTAADPAAELVARLGSDDFAAREAAAKGLRALGLKAEAALKNGAKSDDAEVRARCAELLGAVRKGALDAFVKGFDPAKEAQPDHPVWRRFRATAGDTPASRELFARILKRPEWVARLGAAEAGPEAAAGQYRDAVAAVGARARSFMSVTFMIPLWPADAADETAFLLFLGGYPGAEKAAPNDSKERELFDLGEGRIQYGRGLPLGLGGEEAVAVPGTDRSRTVALPAGSDRAFWRLFAAWLPRRAGVTLLYNGFSAAVTARAADVLPAARDIAADGTREPGARVAALRAVAQFGDRTDLPLFAALYDDRTAFALSPPPTGASPGPRSRRLRADDNALALALLLCDRDPAEYGFAYAKGKFRREAGRPAVAGYEAEAFGFPDDEARAAAHGKAKAFLAGQKPDPKKDEPKPDPAELVKRLGSADFAAREAAERALKELGSDAKAAVRAGTNSDDPEVARRCVAILPALNRADWQRAKEAFEKDSKAFDHPVWARLNAVAGDGPDARAILADLVADERAFVAVSEVIDNPTAAPRLHNQAHERLARSLKDWYAADPKRNAVTAMPGWSPDRGAYPAMLLLGTFPGTGAEPAHRVGLNAQPNELVGWHVCWFGLTATEPRPKGAMRKPSAALQRLFVAWLGTRANPDAAAPGFSTLRTFECREGVALARAVASDAQRPARARGQALLYLGTAGTADDATAAAAAFDDPRVFESTRGSVLQVRDLATVTALTLHGEEPADWGFSTERGAGALKNVGAQSLGFPSDVVRDPLLKAAQAKANELTAARARVAPAPRPRP